MEDDRAGPQIEVRGGLAALPRRVRSLVTDADVEYGDIGILSLTTFGVRAAVEALKRANIPVLELTHYDGRPIDAVKVGTVKRAKGLEFKQVLMAQVPAVLLPGDNTPMVHEEGAAAEHTELQKRQLYVGMTRARERLGLSWASARSPGQRRSRRPSRFLDGLRPVAVATKRRRLYLL